MNTALLELINRDYNGLLAYGIPEQEVIPTGIPQLDAVIGGGIPRGRIVEIYGAEDSGKTALALHMARRLPGPTLYVDADHGLSPYITRRRDLYLLNVDTLEDTADACLIAARSGAFGSIVIDSVTAMPTSEDLRISINDDCQIKGEKQAKIMSKFLPIVAPILHQTGTTLILTTQLRNKPGIIYGRPDRPTGGRAIGYYSALRLETHRYEIIKSGTNITGQKILVSVEKSKYSSPGRRAVARMIYGAGMSA